MLWEMLKPMIKENLENGVAWFIAAGTCGLAFLAQMIHSCYR